MDSLTLNNNLPYETKRPTNVYEPIPLRWINLLHLHLAGKSHKDIALETGYCENSVYRILNHPNIQHVRQQLLQSTQQEFEALFTEVIKAVREGLDDPDPKIKLAAVSQWLKAHGKQQTVVEHQTNITAEDIVFQILNNNESCKEGCKDE